MATTTTETATTIKETIEVITPYLQQIADKLGTTGEYLWKLQVTQAYVDASCIVAFYVLTMVAAYGFYKLFRFVLKSDSEERLGVFIAFCGFVLIPMIVFCIFKFKTLMTILINPEYYALTNIITMVKGGM